MIIYRTFWLGEPKCTETDLKKSQICPSWGQSDPIWMPTLHPCFWVHSWYYDDGPCGIIEKQQSELTPRQSGLALFTTLDECKQSLHRCRYLHFPSDIFTHHILDISQTKRSRWCTGNHCFLNIIYNNDKSNHFF